METTVLTRAGHERAICNKHTHMSYGYIKPEYSNDTTFIEHDIRSYIYQRSFTHSNTALHHECYKTIVRVLYLLRFITTSPNG